MGPQIQGIGLSNWAWKYEDLELGNGNLNDYEKVDSKKYLGQQKI